MMLYINMRLGVPANLITLLEKSGFISISEDGILFYTPLRLFSRTFWASGNAGFFDVKGESDCSVSGYT